MARKQSRRCVSFNRDVYAAMMRSATEAGMSCSEWITQMVRERVPTLPQQKHVDPVARSVRTIEPPAPRVFVACATPVPPHEMPRNTKLEIATAEALRRRAGIAAGTLCANCVDARATHMGRVDLTGTKFPLCDACELPTTEKR